MSNMLRYLSSKPAEKELGFGRQATTEGRMMNADGSFNVERESLNALDNTYYYLITISWSKFFALVVVFYVALNLLFAGIYCLIGVSSLNGIKDEGLMDNFLQAYFFSSQTLTTVGYGHISPNGLITNIIASAESFFGLLFFALISGLLYGRFSRPNAKVVFSEKMLVAPYKDGKALMFRMANTRKSELIETEAQVILTINQLDESGKPARRFYILDLEISKISFFSLSWTLVHPLDEKSPLFGFGELDLIEGNAEFLVLVKGTDEANHQTVYARRSYIGSEIVWNAKFKPIIGRNTKGLPLVHNRKIGDHELILNKE